MTEKEMEAKITQAHIDGYNRGFAKAEEKIADIKANCDLAIEGRDIKIKELTVENAGLKERLELLNLNANIAVRDLNDLLTKATEIIKSLIALHYNPVVTKDDLKKQDKILEQAEQFLKELEIQEDRLCEYCAQYKSCPDGKRCRTCDNGSKWKRSKENE